MPPASSASSRRSQLNGSVRRLRSCWRECSKVSSSYSPFPPPFRLFEPLGHPFVALAVARPTGCGTVPTVVLHGHVDASVDEVLHRLVGVRQKDEMVEDARRLVRVPIRVDVRAVLDQEVRDAAPTVADKRRLVIEAASAPSLAGAELVESRDGRHEYAFDAAKTGITELLAQAASQVSVTDVEAHRSPIDDVIADLYESWKAG